MHRTLLWSSWVLITLGLLAIAVGLAMPGLVVKAQSAGLLPDLRSVVPQHLQIHNAQQREILRFSTSVANTGAGPWQMRPEFPLNGQGTQNAIQEILDAAGNIVSEATVSRFEWHAEHNHWHIDKVALFEVRQGSLTGPIYGDANFKTTFCLIDWYKLDDNSPSPERRYKDCITDRQGVSNGWADQYHQSVPGQELDITGAPPGLYYFIVTANPDNTFIESNPANNTAWVSFQLTRESNGNPKIQVVDHSPCETPGLCGENIPNR